MCNIRPVKVSAVEDHITDSYRHSQNSCVCSSHTSTKQFQKSVNHYKLPWLNISLSSCTRVACPGSLNIPTSVRPEEGIICVNQDTWDGLLGCEPTDTLTQGEWTQ